MSELDEIGQRYGTDKSSAYHDYCRIYERELPRSINVLVELGVLHGASMRMWREWYPRARLYGVDIDDKEIDGATFIKSDLSKASDLNHLRWNLGQHVDVLIDDAGHHTYDQFMAFCHLWPCIVPGGVYVIEDTHTSYERKFTDNRGFHFNMIDWLKSLVDVVNWQGSDGRDGSRRNLKNINLTEHEKTIESITFYKSLCFVRKLL